MSVVIGIDPGKKGAVAIRNGCDVPFVFSTPMVAGDYDLQAMKEAIGYLPADVFIEDLSINPKFGTKQLRTQCSGWGYWIGIIATLGLSYTVVRPKTWQKAMLVAVPKKSVEIKARTIQAAQRLFPMVEFGKDDNKADALLIMEYGRRTLNGKGAP